VFNEVQVGFVCIDKSDVSFSSIPPLSSIKHRLLNWPNKWENMTNKNEANNNCVFRKRSRTFVVLIAR
jgi:hypothetical protein